MRLRWVAVAVIVAAGALASSVAHGQEAGPSVASVTPFAGDPRARAEVREVQEAVEARERWLDSAAAREARLRSRQRFRGRLGAGARTVARETFGPMVTGPLWEPPELAANEQQVEVLENRVMVIERDGEPAGIIDSSVPLEVEGADGVVRPTDVNLQANGEGFTPGNPVTSTTIGERIGDGVQFDGDAALRVTPSMPRPNAEGVLSDGRVFYADAAADTDVIVGATPTGTAIHYQLRSPSSPSVMELDFELPAGAELRAASDGLGGAEVVRGDKVIATVQAPVAVDAQGQEVPSRYRLATDRVTVSVDHAAGDYAYPILLDPVVEQQLWWTNSAQSVNGWFYVTPWTNWFIPSTSGSWGNGIYSILGASRFYGHTSWGEWRYPLYGTSFVYKMWFGWERQEVHNPAQGVCMSIGLYDNGVGWDWNTHWTGLPDGATGTGPRVRCNNLNKQISGGGTNVCLLSGCGVPGSHAPNYPVFSQWIYGDAVRDGWNVTYLGGSRAYITDSENPSISGGPAASASDPNQTWSFSFSDAGLGVKEVRVDSPGNTSWSQAKSISYSCAGRNWSKCPAAGTISGTLANLPPGTRAIRIRVQDVGGKATQIQRSVGIQYHWASLQYGGSNGIVDSESEEDALGQAIATRSDYASVWQGLSATDKNTMLGGEDAYYGSWAPRIDTRAPGPVEDVDATDVDPGDRTADIYWTPGLDPDIEAGVPGSGDDGRAEYRYRRAGGEWIAWRAATEGGFTFTSADAGDEVYVEVRGADRAGHVAPQAAATVTVPHPVAEATTPALVIVPIVALIGGGTIAAYSISSRNHEVRERERESDIQVRKVHSPTQSFEDWEDDHCRSRRELRRNMRSAGKLKNGHQAHHIVAICARKARRAREVLWRCGVRPNDAINGASVARKYHNAMHTNSYYNWINETMYQRFNPFSGLDPCDINHESLRNALTDYQRYIETLRAPGRQVG